IMYADVDGTIGWVAACLTPVRKNGDGLLPVPGASGQYDWQGFLPVKDLPQSFNPATHYLATANHNILPSGYPHMTSYEWVAPSRHATIKKRLEAKKRFDLDDFQSIQHDSTSLPGQTLARFARTVDMQDPALRPYAELLAQWDGVLSRESRAGPLYTLWMQELLDGFFRPHVPERSLEYARSRNNVAVMMTAL